MRPRATAAAVGSCSYTAIVTSLDSGDACVGCAIYRAQRLLRAHQFRAENVAFGSTAALDASDPGA